tara:strand:- start:214 stop:444 length:231 start_codon:yes stop_codon:yes gene_type:complete
MSSLINTQVKPFNATDHHKGNFVELSDADLKVKGSIFFFYPADFTFVFPTESGDLATYYVELKELAVEVYSIKAMV